MSSEPRHGPVTMHRSIERAMLREVRQRGPDAPMAKAGDESDATAGDAGRGDEARPAVGATPRGQRTRLRRRDGTN
jgi:hypothetical protein